MRRIPALCLMAALVAYHGTGLIAAVAAGPDGDHHHPGCPWEVREGPCPHATSPASPDAPVWASCPAAEASPWVAVGPDFAPPADPRIPCSTPPVSPLVFAAPEPVRELPNAPDPEPPRGSLPIV
ncbi:MAG: hypothetical protein KY397_06410 [Gemmatimonadetes bacterium]|nr:hypothetical protein [Gemmatimonadota bacterium]